jgi:hypothetical protein
MPYRRFALGFAIALPVALLAGHAFAFSYTDGPPGYGNGSTFADPDSQFDAMSEHMTQMYSAETPDYSNMLTADPASATGNVPASTPRLPTNIGGNR